MTTAVLNRVIIRDEKIEKVIWVSFFVLATAFGAQVRIPLPFTPVPLTLQTFFVLLSGAYLGKKLGGLSQFLYFLLGGLGLPLFTSVGALWGPTGGYIFGFIIASWFVGFLIEKKIKVFYAFLLGDLLLLSCGAVNLSFFVGSFKNAIILGVFPFIVGDLLKIFAATSVLKLLHR
ncbi:MAG: BioY family transporter [Elusimicrobia bacterium HGW-Elusimicrobia-4]|nr:MAG: BioY family transporter [Elusimicrobia bacterium HGW-Elusimicrobia-4]